MEIGYGGIGYARRRGVVEGNHREIHGNEFVGCRGELAATTIFPLPFIIFIIFYFSELDGGGLD